MTAKVETAVLNVVVVDDSLAIQRSLGRLLRSVQGVELAGFAADVPGALSLIDAVHPDVVVLDVNLQDGDRGIDVLHYVRRQRPATAVIVLSNFVSPRVRENYLVAGAQACFDKASEFMQARDWVAALAGAGRRPH